MERKTRWVAAEGTLKQVPTNALTAKSGASVSSVGVSVNACHLPSSLPAIRTLPSYYKILCECINLALLDKHFRLNDSPQHTVRLCHC